MEVRGNQKLRSSLALSTSIHAIALLFWTLMVVYWPKTETEHAKKWTMIEIDSLPKSFTKPRQKVDEKTNNRIVETERGQKVDKAAPNAFLGERTQTVDRETISNKRLTEAGKAAKVKPKHTAPAKRQAKVETKVKAKPFPALSQLGLPIFRVKPTTSETQENPHPDFSVDEPREEGALEAQVPHDYIKGMKEGEKTALNTKEYMFFGYFKRIRERLDLAWNGILKDKITRMYYSGRQLASEMDHTTRLLVTLNDKGEVIRIQTVEESGTRDLDEAAIRAFNDAGPFPNPPQGLVDSKGVIAIRWDFVLKT